MASLLTTLGLRTAEPQHRAPSLAAAAIIWQFIFSYCVTSPRFLKSYHNIDHNENPRQDVGKYGQQAVANGRLTQAQLDRLQRAEAAQQNGIEHFPFFVGAVLCAQMAGLPATTINRSAVLYTVSRILYTAIYIIVETPALSNLRSVCWWIPNVLCMRLLWLSGKAFHRQM